MKKLAAVFLLYATTAASHDWYPSSCCSGYDCKPVPVEDVQLIDGNYIVNWGGQSIAFDTAQPSPDGKYHICTSAGNPQGRLLSQKVDGVERPCFWAPQSF